MANVNLMDKNNQKLPKVTMSENAVYVAKTRYGLKDKSGKILEEPEDIFWRVASNVAVADKVFGASPQELEETKQKFFGVMAEQKFFPNTPCLVNAGKRYQQMSACFVLPIDDSMDSILKTMSDMAKIHKSGGGTGFSFTRLRPYGDYIESSGGTTVGPVSFMQAYNDVTSQIKQGGVRRGANMGMLSIDHPDVFRFAVTKLDEYSLTNFNISLAVTDKFMAKVKEDEKYDHEEVPEAVVESIREAEGGRDADAKLKKVEEEVAKLYDWAKAKEPEEGYELVNPRSGEVTGKLNAFKVFKLVTRLAWQYGDPGLVFIDRMNNSRSNPVPKLGRIEATNPCGEQPLLPYDACNLGSINLANFVLQSRMGNEGDLDWDELSRVTKLAVHFLDNVVEVNQFPVEEIRQTVRKYRRIGLGVMGFSDMLFKLKVAYDSEEGVAWARKVMRFIEENTKLATVELAKRRGVFPAWEDSVYAGTDYRPRNMALTTIAPTGTISVIADTSSGIEPAFLLAYQKNTVEGKTLYYTNQVLETELKRRGIYSEELAEKIVKNGGMLEGIEEIPGEVKKVFRTALEIDPEWHIKIQAAFQDHVDNAVSKTINFPREASVEEVRRAYKLAYELGTKGITIYRTGSREKEILQSVSVDKKGNGKSELDLTRIKPEKKKTPETAKGLRIKKGCDMGNVYTSVFYEEGDGPVEVFVTLGKSGGYMAGAAEVTGRLASLALKYGATLEEVGEELVGISCGQVVGLGKGVVLSMFDAVGKSILEIARGEQLDLFSGEVKVKMEMEEKPERHEELVDVLGQIRAQLAVGESKFSLCPDCGSPLIAEEGCFKCVNDYCGYSKCS